MERKIYFYAGYYETFISDKDLTKFGYSLLGVFDSVIEAEDFGNENYDDDWGWIDRDLLDESQYYWPDGGDDYYMHTFEVTKDGLHFDEVPED